MTGALELIEGAASFELVELSAVKASLGISAIDSSRDIELMAVIRAVGGLYASAEGLARSPWRQTYRDINPLVDGADLYLTQYPVDSAVVTSSGELVEDWIIDDNDRRSLYRRTGWPGDLVAEYTAGWLMPGQLVEWQPETPFSIGAWVRDGGAPLLSYKAISSGESADSAPVWPTVADETVIDGSVTWQASRAAVLPEEIRQLALVRVQQIVSGGLEIPAGIESMSDPAGSVRFERSARSLNACERAVLGGYR